MSGLGGGLSAVEAGDLSDGGRGVTHGTRASAERPLNFTARERSITPVIDYGRGVSIEPLNLPTAAVGDLELLPELEQRTVALFLGGIANRHTRTAYGNDIAAYVRWLHGVAEGRDGWSLLDATSEAAAMWSRWMVERQGLASATVARRQSALSKFYRWGRRPGRFHEGRTNPFDADMIDRTKPSSTPTPALTAKQVADLMRVVKASRWPGRDYAVVALMVTTGMRVSELCGASHSDVVSTAAGLELVVLGKGNKRRNLAIIPPIAEALGVGQHDPSAPLIPGNDGGRLNPAKVARILRRLARAAGIEKLTPHMLRATQITEALAAGVALWAVQDNAGHADPRTTRGYQRRAQSGAAKQAMGAAVWARIADAG